MDLPRITHNHPTHTPTHTHAHKAPFLCCFVETNTSNKNEKLIACKMKLYHLIKNVKSLNANVVSNLKTASRRLSSESEKRTSEQTTYAATNQTSHVREHPERMPQLKDVTASLDAVETKQNEQEPVKKPVKKAKWHLGIRSQSKPQDIMNEVFKAMKNNSMQWKYYNSSMYNLRVRKPVGANRFVKIGLQLYQVDQKSYLLDFRFFDQFSDDATELDEQRAVNKEIGNHNVMEFFELCADLIGSLAR